MADENRVLLSTLVTGVLLWALFLLLLEVLRRLFPRQYQYRARLASYYPLVTDGNGKRIWAAARQPAGAPLSWLRATWAVTDVEIARGISIDALVMLRFLRSLARVYVALSLLTCVTLLPAYATGPHKNLDRSDPLYVSGVLKVTMSNVERGGPQLWATWIVEVGVMLILYIASYRDFERFTWYARKSRAVRTARNFAALVTDIPPQLACADGVRRVFERVYSPHDIVAVHFYTARPALDKALLAWTLALTLKERAMWRTVHDRKLAKHHQRPTHDPHKKCCSCANGTGEAVDSIEWYAAEQERLRVEIARAQRECRERDAAQVARVGVTAESRAEDAAAVNTSEKLSESGDGNIGASEKHKGGNARLDGSAGESNARAAIVVFRTMHAAATARQTQLWKRPQEFVVAAAPDPKEVRWHKLGVPTKRKPIGSVLTFVLCVSVTLLWSPISLGIAALSNLEALTELSAFAWLQPILTWPAWLLGIIQGVLPPLLINLLSLLVYLLFRFIITRGRHFAQGEVEDRLRNYFFFFLVMGHFLYVLVSGSILSQLADILTDLGSFIELVALAIPAQSIYFCNYVFFGCAVTFPQLLSGWIRIFQRGWVVYGLAAFPKTEREWRRLDAGMSSMFLYSKFYALPLLIHLIAMVYSSVAPLINLFACLYFTVAYFAVKHNLCFTHYNAFSTGGYYYFGVYSSMILSLFIKQVFMVVLFSVFGAPAQAALEALFLITSIITTVITFRRFRRLARQSSIVTIMDSYGKTIGKEDEVAPRYVKQYVPPSLQPLPYVYDLSGLTEEEAAEHGLDLDVGNPPPSEQGLVGGVPLAPRL